MLEILIASLNAGVGALVDLLLLPFRGISPVWALVWISAVAGILLVWFFGKVSDQEAIGRIRRTIRGNLLAVRIYRHEIRTVLGLEGEILRDTLHYARQSVRPVLWLAVPVLLILAQLHPNFSERPFRPGEAILVQSFVEPEDSVDAFQLKVPDGLRLEAGPVRIPSRGEVTWRVRAERPGRYRVEIEDGESTTAKQIVVDSGWNRVAGVRSQSLVSSLFYPGEEPIPSSSPVHAIRVDYPVLDLSFLGLHPHWLLVFFLLSLVVGFSLKGVLGVEI